MNQMDVAGILQTYSLMCAKARDTEQLKELVRRLKQELNSGEMRKMKVDTPIQ